MEPIDSLPQLQQNSDGTFVELPYFLRITLGKLSISLMEVEIRASGRTISIEFNGVRRGEIELSPYYTPSIAIGDRWVYIWGGYKAYILPLSGEGIHLYEHDDEIHWLFELNELFCLVSELSVSLLIRSSLTVVSDFQHNEVILDCHWDGDLLTIHDLQNQKIRFHVTQEHLRVMNPGQ